MNKLSDALISGNAYKIFVCELFQHLNRAQKVFQGPDALPSVEDAKTVGRNFHTIRGGAGFFGLEEMTSAAREIETMLLKAEGSMTEKIDTIRRLLKKIEALAKDLPPPKV